ncbi:MAG: transglutaminase domain-containing protein [Betaproteobacteria bacterium]
MKALLCRLAALAAFALLAGCQSLYFHDAGSPAPRLAYRLSELPFSQYWTGIVFNGEKIGFTHFAIHPADDGKRYEIRAEASFVLRFLGIEKKIALKARDLVDDELGLLGFEYDYRIDGSELIQSGRKEGERLHVTITTAGKPSERTFPVPSKLYPSSVIALYPVVRGLRPGADYAYTVYDGQTQTVAEVAQQVIGYERSQFFEGNAYKLETRLHGQSTTTWIDREGRPVFELALRGVMISALEEEERAKRYIALGALNRKEALIEFSLIRPDAPLAEPRRAARMTVEIAGMNRLAPAGHAQQCRQTGRDRQVCEIGLNGTAELASSLEKYLGASLTVQSRDPGIRAAALQAAPEGLPVTDRIAGLVAWLDSNIEKVPVDVFSALDAFQQKKAECQGHAYLYTAMARALGIPTRVVSGLAYSEQLQGFLFHSWAESMVEGRWVAVDPTFGQPVADATHIKLLEGESLADLLPLIDWVGRVKIRVLALEHRSP